MTRENAELTEDLAVLTRAADALDVSHSIPSDADQLLGRRDDLRTAAESWRELADAVERASGELAGKLGGIDAAWDGADADAFLAHARELGLSGNELTDTMRALAETLEHTAEALRVQSRDLRELVADAVEEVREATPERARERLLELAEPVDEVLEAVRASYRELARRCDELGGEQPQAESPAAPREAGAAAAAAPEASASPGTSASPDASNAPGGTGAPQVPAGTADPGGEQPLAPGGTSSAVEPSEDDGAAVAAGGVAGAAVGAAGAGVAGGMMPMGMMGGMLGRQGAGAQERSNESRIKNNPEDLFGTPPDAAPAVFGEPEEEPDEPPAKLEVPSTLQPGEPKPSIEDTLGPKN